MPVIDLSKFRAELDTEDPKGAIDLTPFKAELDQPEPAANPAEVNLSLSADANPDEKARARALATQTGWPSPLVESDPKAAESYANRPDFQTLDAALSSYLAESPDHAAISKDDLPALDKVAKGWRLGVYDEKAGTETRGISRRPEDVKTREVSVAPYTFGDVVKSGSTRVAADVGLAFTGMGESLGGAISWITRDRAGQETTEFFAGKSEKLREIAAAAFGQKEYSPDGLDALFQGAASQAAFWGPSVGVRLLGATVAKAGPLVAKVAMYGADAWGVVSEALTEAGGTYKELRAGGASQEKSADVASKVFWSNVAVIALSNRLGVLSGEGVAQGALFEGGQEAFQSLAPEAAKASEGLPTRPAPEIAEETVMSAFIGAMLGGPAGGIVSMAPKASEPLTAKNETEQFVGGLKALNAAVNEAKTFQRAPDLMEKFLTEHVGIGADVYISGEEARELYQANGPLLKKLGVNQATVEEAAALGGDVKVPMAAVAALPAEEFATVADSLKAGPAAYSKKEAAALATPEAIERETQRFAREAERQVEYQRELGRITADLSNSGLSGEEVRANTALVDAYARGIEAMGGDRVRALQGIGTIRQVEDGAARIPGELESYLRRARRRQEGAELGPDESTPSLVAFLIKKGGLRDAGGELAALEASRPGLTNKAGTGLDRAALNAWEAGYFPEFTEQPGVDDLVTAIRDELAGSPRYSETVAAEDRAVRNADIDGFEAWLKDAGLTLESPDAEIAKAWEGELEQRGLTPPVAEIESLISEAEGIEDADTKRRVIEGLRAELDSLGKENQRRGREEDIQIPESDYILSPAAEAFPGIVEWLETRGLSRDQALEAAGSFSGEFTVDGKPRTAESLRSEWVGELAMAARSKEMFQSAFHGSPHIFDKFTTSKIGTGEGAQAYGWGLYFAGAKEVAEYYKNALADVYYEVDGERIENFDTKKPEHSAISLVAEVGVDRAVKRYFEMIDNESIDAQWAYEAVSAAEALRDKKVESKSAGRLYHVELAPSEDEYLLWDKPLSEQSEKIQNAIRPIIERGESKAITGAQLYKNTGKSFVLEGLGLTPQGQYQTAERDRQVSEYLHSLGIRGIKYLDGTSRASGEGNFNYVIFSEDDVEIKAFEQAKGAAARRGRTFWQNGKANIEVFKNAADASTIPHELAHVFLEQFRDIATTIQGTDQAYEDWAVLKEWLGITDDTKPLTVEQHEQFAEGFEVYLREGRAPSKKLESAFIRFRNWLVEVYKSALALRVPMTDDVRSVYGRLLASQEETNFASAQLGLAEVSDLEAGNLGLSDDEKAHARRVLKSAKDTAVALLDKDRNRDLAKKKKQWALDAADEAASERVYRLRASIAAKGQGLDIDMVRDEYGPEAVADISRRRPGSVHSDGRVPGAVASEFGYAYTGEMIDDLRNAPSKAERIAQIIEAKQKAHDAEFSAQEALLESEAVAEYLDVLGRLLSKKPVAEEKKRGRAATMDTRGQLRDAISADDDLTRQAAQIYAMQTVESIPVSAATNNKGYVAAMARALKNVSRFVISGNVARAREENDKAKVNYHLARESARAKKRIDKILANVKRFTKSETVHVDYSDAIKELAVRYGLAKVKPTNAEVKSLKALALGDGESPDLSSAPIADWMDNRSDRRDWKALSYGELSDLYDAMKWLDGEGRRLLAGDKAALLTIEGSLADVQARLLPEMEKVKTKAGIRQSDPLKKAKQIIRNLSASNMQLLWLTRTWDNFQNFGREGTAGEAEKVLYGAVRDGTVDESRIKSDWGATLLDMVSERFSDRIGKLDRPKRVDSEVEYPIELRAFYNEDSWSFLDVLSVALNMGNEHNMTALMEGYRKRDGSNYTRDDLMRLTSILTKEDWQAIQKIGDQISSAYPELAAAYRKINYGVEMKRVEPTPFVNPAGEVMRGWYFPLMADSNIFKQAAKEESKEFFLDQAATAFRPAVRKGSTIARQKSFGGRPVSLNALNTITRHVDFVAKYVAWGGRIRDLDRILQSEPIANEITRISGPEMYGRKAAGGRSDERATLRGHLKRLAGRDEQQQNDADRAAMWLKNRTTPIILLRNPLRIAMTQTAGVIRAVSEVGAGSLANGYIYGLAMNGGPAGTHRFITENDSRMAARMGKIDQAFVDHQKYVSSRPEGWVKTAIEKAEEIMAKPSAIIDALVLEPVWMDTYMKALKISGGNHQAAVTEASNKVAGIQPFFEEMDRSAIQSSKTVGAALTTFFFSDAAQQSNRYAFATRGWRSGAISTPAFVRMMFYEGIVTPVYINVLRAAMYGTLGGALVALGGGGGRDDEEKKKQLLSDIGWDIVAERFRGTPYVKDILNVSITAARAKIEGMPMKAQQFSPLAHGPNLFVNAVATTAELLTADKQDPKKKEKYVFALADLLSFGTGIPVSGVAKELYRTIDQVESGKGGPGKYIGIPTPDYLLRKGR